VSDIDTAVADSLKVLDLKRPIREADIIAEAIEVRLGLLRIHASQRIRFCSMISPARLQRSWALGAASRQA